MPVNGFTVGRDVSIAVQTPSGPLMLSLITKFTRKPDNTVRKIKGLDGITRPLIFPDGWSGTIEIERQDSVVEDSIAAWEAGYFAGQDRTPSTITETVTNANGTVSQYQFTGVFFQLETAGEAAGDESVKVVLTFMAEQRIKIM
jgi:hypothetical protein